MEPILIPKKTQDEYCGQRDLKKEKKAGLEKEEKGWVS
jgi:hypothetical protein